MRICDASSKGVELFLFIVAGIMAYEKELINCFSNANMAIRLSIAAISQQGETLVGRLRTILPQSQQKMVVTKVYIAALAEGPQKN
jgi:hypothetical protein